ncbi:MAG: OB-fold domain-containing protein [Dehalococcoidia bacterium]|nr:OB-fold domain-containing protein [Dehalococcoidia bacterium]
MVGITRSGAYVPWHRMGKGTEAWTARGERAVSSFDEDSITMAVAAGLDCLGGMDLKAIDAVYFASTTSPFREKQAATLIAKALDLRDGIFTADFAGSLRAGTTALKAAVDSVKAGTARNVLVVAAEQRVPQPRSDFDENFGDGAAAFLVGKDDVVALVEDIYSYSQEIYDVWRTDTDLFPRSAEDRFVLEEGYIKSMKEAAAIIMGRNKLIPKDFAQVVAYAPSARKHTDICRSMGFDEKTQLAPSYFGQLGDTGCALVPMMLAGAIEKAKAGQRILVASYGEGSDVLVLKIEKDGVKPAGARGLSGHLASKKLLPSYITYLRWRGLVNIAFAAKRPPLKIPGVHAVWREVPANISLYGSKCHACGTVQYPAERVCTQCQAVDKMAPWKMPKRGSVFTYSMDYLGPTPDPPMVLAVVDLEGGARGLFVMTDRDPNEVKVGMPIELSFRRLHTVEGIHNYYWCAIPIRS